MLDLDRTFNEIELEEVESVRVSLNYRLRAAGQATIVGIVFDGPEDIVLKREGKPNVEICSETTLRELLAACGAEF